MYESFWLVVFIATMAAFVAYLIFKLKIVEIRYKNNESAIKFVSINVYYNFGRIIMIWCIYLLPATFFIIASADLYFTWDGIQFALCAYAIFACGFLFEKTIIQQLSTNHPKDEAREK